MKFLPLLVVASLSLTVATVAYGNGGDASGGGSSVNGRLLDTFVKRNSIKPFSDVKLTEKLRGFDVLLSETMPDMGNRLRDFYDPDRPSSKRFIAVKQLPKLQEKDVIHEVADELVGIQRGPNVWVKEGFWAAASPEEKADFIVHEFFVAEKLKKGELSGRDREEVIHATAALSEKADMAAFAERERLSSLYAKDLQKILERNHFEAALTKDEQNTQDLIGEKFMKAIRQACDRKKPDPAGFEKIRNLMKFVERRAKDEELSQAMRAEYRDSVERSKEFLAGGELETLCGRMREHFQDVKDSMEATPNPLVSDIYKALETKILGDGEEEGGAAGAQ